METTSEPHLQDLQYRGWIQGLLIKQKSTGKPLCYYYGGLPYALPPVGEFRFRRPRQLAPCYQYGTRHRPGVFDGKAGICPQPGKKAGKSEEDCLQVNIWVPTGTVPEGGWPVYVYIHGGFLQFGSANEGNPLAFITQTDNKCIVVKVAYRLNVFGFLAVEDPNAKDAGIGNLGFWDQRLALEWVWKNISFFDGNAGRIVIGGYSAGAHSVWYQLQYDLRQPAAKQIIRAAAMHSNGPGVQPRPLREAHTQYAQLIAALNIPASLSLVEKLSRLRALPAQDFITATRNIPIHQFRAVTDGDFVPYDLVAAIASGAFGKLMRERGVQLWIGENAAEHFVYATWRPPREDGVEALERRLRADYPRAAAIKLARMYLPSGRLPEGWRSWQEAFGHVYADVQVHMSMRGLLAGLEKGGAGGLVHRYRIEWRSRMPSSIPWEWGPTHGADGVIWFFGEGRLVPNEERSLMKVAFLDDFARFVRGEGFKWGCQSVREARRLRSDGTVDVWRDDYWDRAMELWNGVLDVNETAHHL